MGIMQKTAIIVPCYNESKRLRINEFKNYLCKDPRVSFIFINDGSTDNTIELINKLCSIAPHQVISKSLEKNRGKAEAVRQGFLIAFELGFQNIGYWDADLSTPLHSIKALCELLKEDKITIVMGSRVRLLGYSIKRGAVRHYLGRIFATFASLILGLHVYDTQCGAKIFKNNSELKTVFAHPFLVDWIFDVEILTRFKLIRKFNNSNLLQNTTLEYPLDEWTAIGGSKVRFIDFFKAIMELTTIFLVLNFSIITKKYMEKFRCEDELSM
jgi:glycosyltransferase involved in cell wall biosynthesis